MPTPGRGIGGAEFASSLPGLVRLVAGVLTQLGDAWFLLLVVAYVAVRSDRNGASDALFLLSLLVAAYALTAILKTVFALGRPPGASVANAPVYVPGIARGVYRTFVTGTGYGFPSGHALVSTAVYGGAALEVTADRRRGVATGVAVVAVIMLARVILGVHYVVDVLVGAALGLLLLSVFRSLSEGGPRRVLSIASGLAVLAFFLTPGLYNGLAVLGGVGGLLCWYYCRQVTTGGV